MALPHGGRQATAPIAAEIAEPAVAIAIPLPGAIFLPQQQLGYAGAAEFGLDAGPLRLRSPRLGREGRREQLALQRHVVQRRRHRPCNADHGRPTQILRDRVAADADHGGDLVTAVTTDVFEAEDWLASVGITGWNESESPADLRRNTQAMLLEASSPAVPLAFAGGAARLASMDPAAGVSRADQPGTGEAGEVASSRTPARARRLGPSDPHAPVSSRRELGTRHPSPSTAVSPSCYPGTPGRCRSPRRASASPWT